MDFLERFDEEYHSHQQAISELTSLVLECKDVASSTMQIQKNIVDLFQGSELTIASLQPLLYTISRLLDVSNEIIQSVDTLKNDISSQSKEK